MAKLSLKQRREEVASQPAVGVSKDVTAALAKYPNPRDEYPELRTGLIIDRNSLDDEAIRQPQLFHDVGEQHVMSASERDAAKETLAGIDAKLAHDFRLKSSEAGEKINETIVGDYVQTCKEHIEAYARHVYLVRRTAYLANLKEAYDQRGKMLRELAGLFMVGYFDRVTSGAGKRDVDAARAAMGREAMRKLRDRTQER